MIKSIKSIFSIFSKKIMIFSNPAPKYAAEYARI